MSGHLKVAFQTSSLPLPGAPWGCWWRRGWQGGPHCLPHPPFPLFLKLGWKFYDADDYHPEENRVKMGKGIPLNDQVTFAVSTKYSSWVAQVEIFAVLGTVQFLSYDMTHGQCSTSQAHSGASTNVSVGPESLSTQHQERCAHSLPTPPPPPRPPLGQRLPEHFVA